MSGLQFNQTVTSDEHIWFFPNYPSKEGKFCFLCRLNGHVTERRDSN